MDRQTAVVTGAARGIGRAIALGLAKKGCNVVINYSGSKEAAEETEKLCKEAGAETLVVQADVSVEEDCKKLVDSANERFGSIEILVNNAGITRDSLLAMMSAEDFDEVINVNLKGSFMMMKAVSRQMMKKRFGRIINISSVSGVMGNPGQVNYSASKAGVIGMTKSFAREVASRNITVNAVAPGFIDTDMTSEMPQEVLKTMIENIPIKRSGNPEDIANAVCFLADESSSYITGQVLCVDGGMSM